MKIDFSTIFLVIFLVLPGLFSRRSQNSISPRSLEAQGATEELAEFVAQGVAVHLMLLLTMSLLLGLSGIICHHRIGYYFWTLDRNDPELWCKEHASEAFLLFAGYVTLSFVAGYLLGLIGGVWRLRRPVTSFLLRQAKWLTRWGVTQALGEPPIIYQVLTPKIAEDGLPSVVFVEAEMKGDLGFYSGQVRKYAVVRDAEPHKLVYLIKVWFKQHRDTEYAKVEADGIMIDLADVATLKVDQVSESSLLMEDADAAREEFDPGLIL